MRLIESYFPSAVSPDVCDRWEGARSKLEAGNSVPVFHMSNRDPTTSAVTCCLPGSAVAASCNHGSDHAIALPCRLIRTHRMEGRNTSLPPFPPSPL